MARSQNFFYQGDPTAQITSSLARAVLGDPQARAQQQQLQAQMDERRAQAEESRAHAGLYSSQTEGQGIQNNAGRSLPELIAGMNPRLAPPQVALDQDNPSEGNFNAAFDTSIGPGTIDETPDAAFRRGLPAVVAAMGQMQGDKIDPRQVVGTLASFFGGDEMARRGLVAQGHSPTADFAITPERADTIAANEAGAKQKQAWGVADRQASASRYGSDQRLVGTKYSADSGASASRYGADRRYEGTTYTADSKNTGKAPGFDAIQKVFPGATMNSGFRTPEHNREVGGVSNSTHLGFRPGVQGYDMDVQPGMTVTEAARRIEAANPGVRVIEARDETGRIGPNGKPLAGWHFALQNTNPPEKATKAGGGAAKPPKLRAVTQAAMDTIQKELDARIDERHPNMNARGRATLRRLAVEAYQISGNPVKAVSDTLDGDDKQRGVNQSEERARKAGARKGPDGHWYVKTHPGTADPWSRVD